MLKYEGRRLSLHGVHSDVLSWIETMCLKRKSREVGKLFISTVTMSLTMDCGPTGR